MRTRKEIKDDVKNSISLEISPFEELMEVLLDIRDLLKPDKVGVYNEK